jgi:tetratricopeptide (TPR) repeat protein/DNA-binding CsgD family transcriptional regulator
MCLRSLVLSIFALCILLKPLSAQHDVDSLKNILNHYPNQDTIRVQLLNQLGLEYWIIDPVVADEYGNEALRLAEKLNYMQGTAFALRVLGVANWTRGNYELGLIDLLKSRSAYQKLNDELGVANCHLNIGMIYADQGIVNRALENYRQALDGFEKAGRSDRIATAYNKMGEVYIRSQSYSQALEYLLKALAIHEKNGFIYGVGESNNRLGELFLAKKEYDEALSYFLKAVSISEKLNDADGMARGFLDLGRAYLAQANYSKANEYLRKSENIAREVGAKKWLRDTYQTLRVLAEETGRWKEANAYATMYITMKDSLFNEQMANRIAEIEKRNELAAQEKELEALKNEAIFLSTQNELNRNLKFALAAAMLLLLVSAYLFINRQRLRIKKDRIIYESQQEMANLALQKARLEQSKLEQELATRDKELTSYTVNFIRKNEVINSLKERVQDLKKSLAKSHSKEVQQLMQLANSIQDVDKDWEEFRLYFENVHTDFFKNLNQKFPQLSAGELRLAALIRLNLNLKEISSVLGISPNSVKTARHRLKKRLNLDKEESLLAYLIQMDQTA